MADSNDAAESKAPAATKTVSVDTHDADQLRLKQMYVSLEDATSKEELWVMPPLTRRRGHEQELKRHFTVWSLIGLASTTTISWTGLGLG